MASCDSMAMWLSPLCVWMSYRGLRLDLQISHNDVSYNPPFRFFTSIPTVRNTLPAYLTTLWAGNSIKFVLCGNSIYNRGRRQLEKEPHMEYMTALHPQIFQPAEQPRMANHIISLLYFVYQPLLFISPLDKSAVNPLSCSVLTPSPLEIVYLIQYHCA